MECKNTLANLTYLYCSYLRNKIEFFSSYTFMCQSYILSLKLIDERSFLYA